MTVRLLLVLSFLSLIAGCGGSSDESAERSGQARAASLAPQRDQAPEQEARARAEPSTAADTPGERPARNDPPPEIGEEADGSLRPWTDPSGRVLVRAEFVDFLDGRVCLQEANGLGRTVPFDQLSQADQDYVKGLVGDAAPNPPEEGTSDSSSQLATAAAEQQEEQPLSQQAPAEYRTPGGQKVVIPFDFVSKFDNGRYGRMVGDLIWKKLEGEGGVIIPESMYDVRDTCEAKGRRIAPDTPLEEVGRVVRGDFQADVGIWGSVERAPGHEWDVYDLVIKCVDFSAGPEPKVVYEKSGVRTKVVSEIPHLYVKEMLDKLYDRKPGAPPPVDEFAEANWKNNPTLVQGGDFQQGTAGVPVGWAPGWEAGYVDQYERLGNHVQWIAEAGNPSNRVIRFTFDKGLGDSTGVAYYSDRFPVEEGAKYRFQCRWRTNGAAVKVFIKCYEEMPTEYRTGGTRPSTAPDRYGPGASQLRESYRSQQNLYGPKNTWNLHTQDFTVRQTRYTPRWGKVMLYAYLGAGVVEFDDVVLKQIVPASPGELQQDPRHSMESTVTIKEMEENERRGREAVDRLRQRREEEP